MPTTVARNSYARGEYRRDCITNTRKSRTTCSWCGQSPPRLYLYTWQNDDRNTAPNWRGKLFCSLICHRGYYGV